MQRGSRMSANPSLTAYPRNAYSFVYKQTNKPGQPSTVPFCFRKSGSASIDQRESSAKAESMALLTSLYVTTMDVCSSLLLSITFSVLPASSLLRLART